MRPSSRASRSPRTASTATAADLSRRIRDIDGRGYRSYKSLAGGYRFERWALFIDHVQGDPFATPSKLRLRVDQERAGVPHSLFDNRHRRVALEDFLARAVRRALPRNAGGAGDASGNSGLVTIDAGGQETLERTAVVVEERFVEARIEVGLPAAGRTVLGRQAETLLVRELDALVRRSLLWESLDASEVESFVDAIENQEHLRSLLAERKLVAFVADGAVLPRESGASDLPMRDGVPFRSPDSLRVRLPLLRAVTDPDTGRAQRSVMGMGVPEGVTLVVGGGYHGKSTLLKALERSVYPHVPGDGRELVVTLPDAVKIRAEDGRRVERVDISSFIRDLPMGRSTSSFTSDDASGSTSQAANIMEALEAGSRLLLLDEDTSATNFMVRDARMQALVSGEEEPILPFLDRVRELHDGLGVSTILVMGGSGDYFDHADTVVRMKDYGPEEVTDRARAIAAAHPTGRKLESVRPLAGARSRRPHPVDASRGRRAVKIDARGLDHIVFGRETIDVRALEQLVDPSQARAVGYAIRLASERLRDEPSLEAMLRRLERIWDEHGLDVLGVLGREGEHPGSFARPRRFEVAAAWNRLRSARMNWARE